MRANMLEIVQIVNIKKLGWMLQVYLKCAQIHI